MSVDVSAEGIKARVSDLAVRSQKMFPTSHPCVTDPIPDSRAVKMNLKMRANYTVPPPMTVSDGVAGSYNPAEYPGATKAPAQLLLGGPSGEVPAVVDAAAEKDATSSGQLINYSTAANVKSSSALVARRLPPKVPEPQWHAPWELSAVVSGHLGWVRCIAFDPTNEWFVTGAADRTIKIWDLAKCCAGAEGGLKLTLTGHIHTLRGLAVSSRSPYLFSCGEDKIVNCWDLEYNKVIRHYHGHLSGVMSLALHPTLDLLISGGRDSVARVWDIRTKHQVHVLGGHQGAVGSLFTNSIDPQVTTASYDSTVKLWDLAAGRCMSTLTQHKKSVRSVVMNPKELSFVTASADNIKKWQCRDGTFLKNFSGHNSVINTMAVNDDGVMVSGGDDGSLHFWDYDTGYCFQKTKTIVQPGSLDAEAGIYASAFDLSGSRFITCEADKSIKIWKENTEATEDSHPIDMKGWTRQCLTQKKY